MAGECSKGEGRQTFLYNVGVPLVRNLRVTMEMIKWEHSIFALPFALCGAMLAAGGVPTLRQLLWIIVAIRDQNGVVSFDVKIRRRKR